MGSTSTYYDKMDAKKKIKVIYIMGLGLSGSTILDIILGNHKHIEGTGELSTLFEMGYTRGELCSCGSDPNYCCFWSKIKEIYLKKTGDQDLNYTINLGKAIDPIRKFPKLFFKGIPDRLIKDYCKRQSILFECIKEISNKKIIVDSSKSPARLFALLKCKNLEIFAIHLN